MPYSVLARYLAHFDELVVVGRVHDVSDEAAGKLTIATGDRVAMDCVRPRSLPALLWGRSTGAHVRAVLGRVDCAIIRLPSVIGLVAAREAEKAGKPWMVEVVGCAWDSFWNHSGAGKVAAGPLFVMNRHFIKKARYALYVTERFLQERYPCGGDTIGCSDVTVPTTPSGVLEARVSRVKTRRSDEGLKLGIVGSLSVGYKGHETAIRALARLKDAISGVHLSCLGQGDRRRWEGLASQLGVSDRVEFVGTLPSGEPVLKWMDSLDVYLAPSLQEGMPRALIEAMSRGVPAIGARTGGIPELIPERWIHAGRDHEALAHLVQALASSPDDSLAAARANFDVARRYEASALQSRRHGFFTRFADHVARARRASP